MSELLSNLLRGLLCGLVSHLKNAVGMSNVYMNAVRMRRGGMNAVRISWGYIPRIHFEIIRRNPLRLFEDLFHRVRLRIADLGVESLRLVMQRTL
jgi:hypothetical protein